MASNSAIEFFVLDVLKQNHSTSPVLICSPVMVDGFLFVAD